jgi:CheY-like chemotaxis protein
MAGAQFYLVLLLPREVPMEIQKPVTILLVEDDAGHAVLIEKNLRRAGVDNEVIRLANGQEALDYFFNEGAWEPPPKSYLVLLDLNLPVVDGYQVLKRLKENERTKRIPVVVLTTTENPQEINRCYELGCNVYVSKPVEYGQFCEVIRSLGAFLRVVKIPADE